MEEKDEDDMMPVFCEKDLEAATRPMIAIPVSKIIKHLTSIPAACESFNLGCNLHFSHLNPLIAVL
jgi:hypothetical protein